MAPPKRPASVVCYVCGREYGTRSIHIHLKTCKKMWDKEQENHPKKKRRPCPSPPSGFDDVVLLAQGKTPNPSGVGSAVLDKLESGMSAEQVVNDYNDKMRRKCDEENLEPCPHCGRTFRPEALTKHLGSCRADAPLTKPVK